MGRLITLTAGNDTFRQSDIGANSALVIRSLAGNDMIELNRTDDLGGNNRVQTGLGRDTVINHKEFGNLIALGAGNDTYIGLGFGSFGSDLADRPRREATVDRGSIRVALQPVVAALFVPRMGCPRRAGASGGHGVDRPAVLRP